MLIQRKVAQIIWGGNGGKPGDFDSYWPIGIKDETNKKVWGLTKEEAQNTRDEVMKAHNKVLR